MDGVCGPASAQGVSGFVSPAGHALDPFLYSEHGTSLDALWMGVPVVSLVGDHRVSRAGLSQFAIVGLAELVAYSEDDYTGIATANGPRFAASRGLAADIAVAGAGVTVHGRTALCPQY